MALDTIFIKETVKEEDKLQKIHAFPNGYGDSVIQVTLPDDGNYNSATATFSLEVSKGDPIISHGDLSKNYGESFTLTTSSTSDANVIYTITDTSIATVSGSTVTTKGAGSTTILVNQLENQCYNSISTSMTLDVNTVSQTVSWMTDIYKIFGDEFTLDMPITDSDYIGAITFSSSDPSIASVNSVTGDVIIEDVGAGSVITRNVSKKSLALTRSQQLEVKNYQRKSK